jgi:hypothetical protein
MSSVSPCRIGRASRRIQIKTGPADHLSLSDACGRRRVRTVIRVRAARTLVPGRGIVYAYKGMNTLFAAPQPYCAFKKFEALIFDLFLPVSKGYPARSPEYQARRCRCGKQETPVPTHIARNRFFS